MQQPQGVVAPGAEQREWKTLSADWRRNLGKLIETLDALNKNRAEVERQKEQIRVALTQGKFDVINRERAVAFYNSWNRGIDMLPIHPEDFSNKPPAVYLSPLAPPDGPEQYLYEFEDGLVATQQPREWIRVAPPPFIPTSTVITLPPPPPSASSGVSSAVVLQEEYPITGIAGWRVRRLSDGREAETLSFDDAITIAEGPATPADAAATAKAIALTASQINKSLNNFNPPAPQKVAPVVVATSSTPYLAINQPVASATVVQPLFAPAQPLLIPRPGAVRMRVVDELAPVVPLPPMVPPWRARQQREAIRRQFQRVYDARDLDRAYVPPYVPLPQEDDDEDEEPLYYDAGRFISTRT